MNFLQCGYGTIGKVLYRDDFKPIADKLGSIDVYDPNMKNILKEPISNFFDNEKDLKKHYDISFICVPTPTNENGCDCSIVEDSIKKLIRISDIIVIKSTVKVGFTKSLKDLGYSNLVFSPEYKSVTQYGSKENFLILGGDIKNCQKVAEVYKYIKPSNFKIVFTDSASAEMCKYMCNCFLAMKVTFCNEINEACNKIGIEYDEVRNLFLLDERINPSHTIVFKDHPYYDSHCFNKDIPAFNKQFDLPLMKEIEKINLQKKIQFKGTNL